MDSGHRLDQRPALSLNLADQECRAGLGRPHEVVEDEVHPSSSRWWSMLGSVPHQHGNQQSSSLLDVLYGTAGWQLAWLLLFRGPRV